MISIIICSKNKDIRNSLKQNIDETIGCDYEIVCIDNSSNQYSIFQAYNKGQLIAKYNTIIYVHEDVFFCTSNWGSIIISYFNKMPDLGCIGIAGSAYKTKSPSGWWGYPGTEWALHLVQYFKDKTAELKSLGWNGSMQYKEVVVLDGVFMATKKIENFLFDETIGGFHGYDTNLSLEVFKKGLKVIVTKEILLEHFSVGTIDGNWVRANHYFHKKYNSFLPVMTNQKEVNRRKAEIMNLEQFIYVALDSGLKKIALYYWLRFVVLKPIAKPHFNILIRLLS